MKVRRAALCALILILALLLGLEVFRFAAERGVSCRDVKAAVESESDAVMARVDVRCDALERRLDRIESKLDRLIDLAAPRLPDGMKTAD